MRTNRIFWILSLLLAHYSTFAQLPCGKPDVSYQEELITQKLIQQYDGYSKLNNSLAGSMVYIAVKPHFVRTDAGITTLNVAAFNNLYYHFCNWRMWKCNYFWDYLCLRFCLLPSLLFNRLFAKC